MRKALEHASLPPRTLLEQQASWLAPARSRLLRSVAIARRRTVLDLGAGYGLVTAELARRSGGRVVALDLAPWSLYEGNDGGDLFRVVGDAAILPLKTDSFDLIFSQCALLWMSPIKDVLSEIWRLLTTGGVLAAIEPDYGGLMEYPSEIASRDLWLSTISQAGADPLIGRKLPGLLEACGFKITVTLLDQVLPPSPKRFEFLRDLALSADQRSRLDRIEGKAEKLPGWAQLAHLPFFLIAAEKP